MPTLVRFRLSSPERGWTIGGILGAVPPSTQTTPKRALSRFSDLTKNPRRPAGISSDQSLHSPFYRTCHDKTASRYHADPVPAPAG